MAKRKDKRISKSQRKVIYEQILEDEFGISIDGYTKEQLTQIAGLVKYLSE